MSHHERSGLSLPLLRSPLVTHPEHRLHCRGSEQLDESETTEPKSHSDEERPNVVSDVSLQNRPQFHRHTETTNAELFYDLFFVANMTVFTSVHEVNDRRTLAQYAGFFSILWFTWYQVGLYDIRFSMDSLFERITRFCQFGVMLGFAITGPRFDVGTENAAVDSDSDGPSYTSFKALTLILMTSRFILVLQYVQSLWFTRKFRNTRLPIALIAATYAVAGFIYLGLFWTFTSDKEGVNYSFITWYVVAVAETAITTFVSSYWRVISFKGTHLVQRMSLLTLIILGEGVIGLAKQCQVIVMTPIFTFTSSTMANFVCGLFIVYFLYQMIFDWMQETHFGSIRQQIWAFLHFPLHIMLALALEGMNQNIAWRAGTVSRDSLQDEVNNVLTQLAASNHDQAAWTAAATQANQTATNYLYSALTVANSLTQTVEYLSGFDIIARGFNGSLQGVSDTEKGTSAIDFLYAYSITTAYQVAGFEPPEEEAGHSLDIPASDDALAEMVLEKAAHMVEVYLLAFVYFLVAVGLVVLVCTVMAAISKRDKTLLHWIRLAVSTFVGLGLCLLALLAINTEVSDGQIFANYIYSAWVVPTVTLALALVVAVNSVGLTPSQRLRLVRKRTRNAT